MITKSHFKPHWWLRNPHLQTIVASKFLKRPKVEFEAERLELDDGDFIDLCWSKRKQGDIVCIFHGLAGCIDSAYAKSVFVALEKNGLRPVFMHWRGCSGEPNRLSTSYHSGATNDIHTLVKLVKKRHPSTPVHAVGYSLGANALLKYLGEKNVSCELSAAVCVCPPLVLRIGANKLNSGITKGYQKYLLKLTAAQHEVKRKRYPQLHLAKVTTDLNTFWKFDNQFTAPLHGYNDVHDYYEKCSARQFLPKIDIPTHIIYALDDPFFTPAVLPDVSELNEHVELELSTYGGHVGFLGHVGERDWLSNRICAALKKHS